MVKEAIKKVFTGPSTSSKELVGKAFAIGTSPIRWIIYFIGIIAGLALLFFFVTIGISIFTTETPEWVAITIENLGLEPLVGKIGGTVYNVATLKFLTGEESIGLEGNVGEEENDIKVEIIELYVDETNIQPGETIIAYGEIELKKPLKDKGITLTGSCYLEDYFGEYYQTIPSINEEIIFSPNIENQVEEVSCVFPDGISAKDLKTDKTKKIRLLLELRNEQKISGLIYISKLRRSDDSEKTNDQKNWFRKKGPLNLELGSKTTQPFYEGREYILRLNLKPSLDWQGNIKEVKYVSIKTNPYIRLKTESGDACDFVRGKGVYEYIIKQDILDEVNRDCTNKEFFKNFNECVEKLKQEFESKCPIEIINAPERPSQEKIEAEVYYTFEMFKATLVRVGEEFA